MPTLHALDFDGTITCRDSFPLFIRHAAGTPGALRLLLRHLIPLVGVRLHISPGSALKERIFAECCAGMEEKTFTTLCRSFADKHADSLMRPAARRLLRKLTREGASRVAVVTASLTPWVRECLREFPAVTVIGTEPEVRDGRITGRFATPNCLGPEKVRRLREHALWKGSDRLVAYGDSSGDRELLALADEARWRPFR